MEIKWSELLNPAVMGGLCACRGFWPAIDKSLVFKVEGRVHFSQLCAADPGIDQL